jgi:hypothetical protein
MVVDPRSTEAQPSLAEPPDTVNPIPFDRTSEKGSRPGVNTVLAVSARRGTMPRLIPLLESKLRADAVDDCKSPFLLLIVSFQPELGEAYFPFSEKLFSDGAAFSGRSAHFCANRLPGHSQRRMWPPSVDSRQDLRSRGISALCLALRFLARSPSKRALRVATHSDSPGSAPMSYAGPPARSSVAMTSSQSALAAPADRRIQTANSRYLTTHSHVFRIGSRKVGVVSERSVDCFSDLMKTVWKTGFLRRRSLENYASSFNGSRRSGGLLVPISASCPLLASSRSLGTQILMTT